MSNSGKKSPLNLNAESQLTTNQGLTINPVAMAYQGKWTAAAPYTAPKCDKYVQGSLTSSNVLKRITEAIPGFYEGTPTNMSVVVYRNSLKIGKPIDSRPGNNRINCPALGNSRPDTFKTSYAGFGSFKKKKLGDKFYNENPANVTVGLVAPIYPPYNYPTEGTYSYIYNNWSSLPPAPGRPTTSAQTSFVPFPEKSEYFHEYAWLTGWPGVNPWQSKAPGNPQVAYDPDGDGDSYGAAYFPRPDLAPVQPWRARDAGKIEYDEYFSNGFIATVARQAYYEFWSDYKARRNNQYPEFVKSFQQHAQFKDTTNQKISSFENTKTFIKGNYSNINDLTTSDFAGVNLAFKQFGNDLIRLGKSLDLSQIHLFGLPSKFLLNLQKYNALSEALRLALLYSDLSSNELENILLPSYTPGVDQEKKIYNAFTLISGQDLSDIKVIVNCSTPGLSTLADLINPIKMFPNSYGSLTVPTYNIDTLAAKNYDFIYVGKNTNTRIENWGQYLDGILPPDMALACGAFMMTMNQVKNIRQMNIEKLSQVVANLEVTNKGLGLVNSADGVPGSVALANVELDLIALGSGSAGAYRFCDFMGAMSGWPYRDFYSRIQQLISAIETKDLKNLYTKVYQVSLFNEWMHPSIGKGYPDPYLNPTPAYPVDIPFTFYNTTSSGAIGGQTMSVTNGINYSVSAGNLVTFMPGDTTAPPADIHTYRITGISSSSVNFESILPQIPNPNYQPDPSLPNYDPVELVDPYPGWPGLSRGVSKGEYTYVSVPYDGNYPVTTPGPGAIQDMIDAANIEILRIQESNPNEVEELNYWWDKIGTQLWLEQRAIPFSVPKNESIYQSAGREEIDSFIRSAEEYAQNTDYCDTAPILEAISDLNNIGGQSIVAGAREARNARRLVNTGGETDNDVPDVLNVAQATAVADIATGAVVSISVTAPGSGYVVPPNVTIIPQEGVFGTCGNTENALNSSDDCSFVASIEDYPNILNVKPGWTTTIGTVTGTVLIDTSYKITVNAGCFKPDTVYTFVGPPCPPGQGCVAVCVLDPNGSVAEIRVTEPGSGYCCAPLVVIDEPPQPPKIGDPIVPGSNSGSDYTGQDPVPDILVTGDDSSYTVPEAIEEVTTCNCDCWK